MKWLDRVLGLDRADATVARGDAQRVAETQRVLARLAPLLAADGGAVRLVEVDGDTVVLSWSGACRSCGSRADTLQRGIEPELRAELAWLREVRSTLD